MSLLGDRRVTDLDAMIPPAGSWLVTGHLDSGAPVATGTTATLTIGDLALTGTLLRGGLDSPERPAFVLRGGAGWGTLLPAPGAAFGSPSTVRLSTVLGALGQATGEPYDAPPEARLGTGYGWDAGTPADAVLADLVSRGAIPTWRVTPAGRTVFAPWPALPAADGRGRVMGRQLVRGARQVGLDNAVAAFLPGATLEGQTIARVQLLEHDQELRALVWDATDLGPLARLRRLVLKVLPWLARFGIDPATGNLFVRASDTRIDLAGGGPQVLRVGDVPPLVFDPGIPGTWAPALYLTRDGGATFVLVHQVGGGSTFGGTLPPPPATPTTPLAPSGSGKVTCG